MIQAQEIKLSNLHPNKGQIEGVPTNPRKAEREQIEKLKKSIQDTPTMLELREIIAYDNNGELVIVGGNMRYRALKELGYKTAFVKVLPADTPKGTINAFIIKDNAQFGEWDTELLANDWDKDLLEDWGVSIDWGGEENTTETKEAQEDEFSEEEAQQAPTVVKRGEIYQLGEHRLMCGDSTNEGDIAKLMGGVKADMVLSDPPYGMHLDTDFSSCLGSLGSLGRKHNTKGNKYNKVIGDNDDFTPELITTFFNNFGYCKEMFLFGADYFAEILPKKNDGSWMVWDKRKESQANAIGSEFELVWSKEKHKRRMLRHDWFGFLSSHNQQDARNRVHPTQKPITLLVDIIQQWGDKCEKVVDLYGGSGSTLIACEQLERKCYTMELDPHYCDVIIARWEKLTGKKAVKVEA